MPEANPRAVIGDNRPPTLVEQLRERHAPLFDRLKRVKAKIGRVRDLEPQSEEDCSKLEEAYGEARDLASDAERKRVEEKEPYLQAGKDIDGLFNGSFRDGMGTEKGGEAKLLLDRAARWRLAQDEKVRAAAAEAAAAARKEAEKVAEQAKRQEEAGHSRKADVGFDRADALDRQADALEATAASIEPVRATTAGGRSVSASTKKECTAVNRDALDLDKLRPYLKPADLVAAVNAGLRVGAFQDGLKGAVFEDKIVGRMR